MNTEKTWAEIGPRTRPSQAICLDDRRPNLAYAFIRHRENELLLCATDAYILAEIPILLDLPKERWNEIAPEVALAPEACRALDLGSRFRITDGLLEIEGSDALYRVRTDIQGPNFESLWPKDIPEEGLPSIAFDPVLLKRLADALGVHGGSGDGIKVRFTTPLKPILVKTANGNGSRGLIMPMRDWED